jgi:hypothetical protein
MRPAVSLNRLFTIILLLSGWVSTASGQTISGIGTKECGVYIQAVKLKSDEAINGFVSWAQGYLSGFNATNSDGRDVAIDPGGLNYWLTNYCSAHQNEAFYSAVQQLSKELAH